MALTRTAAVVAAFFSLTLAATSALAQQQGGSRAEPQPDLFKSAGQFIENCDARANAAGERPDETYMSRLCLSFVDGLIAGYTVGAMANGNDKPYCLPRPVTLVEVMDMMATVIDRGVPADRPTAQVFHYLVQVNFPCERAPGVPDGTGTSDEAGASGSADAADETDGGDAN